MAQDPVETLFVNIEGNFSGLLGDLEEAVRKVEARLEALEEQGQKTGDGVGAGGRKAAFMFGFMASAGAKALDVVQRLATAIPQMFKNLAKESVNANAQFETFESQFETLLKSGTAAKERLDELARFGVETPFELPEVVQASKSLQQYGGTALATGENLRMVGDMAATAGKPFTQVAFWVGRLYDNMKSGKPFGEAAMALQEMSVISGVTRNRLEDMQKSGEDLTAMWGFFQERVGGEVAGAMERLAKTFQGVTSNIADFRGELLRTGGKAYFDEVRGAAVDFYAFLEDNEKVITAIATNIGDAAANVVRFVREALAPLTGGMKGPLDSLKSFAEWINKATSWILGFIKLVGQWISAFAPLGRAIGWLVREGTLLGQFFDSIGSSGEFIQRILTTLTQTIALSTAGWKGLFAAVQPVFDLLAKGGQAMMALLRGDIKGFARISKEAWDMVGDGLIDVDAGIQAVNDSMRESVKVIDEMGKPYEAEVEEAEGKKDEPEPEDVGLPEPNKVVDMMDSLTNQMIQATESRNERLAALEQSHAEKVAGILSNANKKRLAIEERFQKAANKLAQDSDDKRLDIIEDAERELAKLGADTDEQLRRQRKDYRKDELRETEDHLREMRQLSQRYLMDLADAVKARDARAVVDLRRKFQQDSQEREEDFRLKQDREREDQSETLARVRETEAKKRDEILANQARELSDLQEHEEEKMIELLTRRAEDMTKLEEHTVEQITRENQSYQERQAALEASLANQLQAIAQNLADENEVTEEGARQILETFNEYFGAGGEIDQLMEGFSKRRRIRADIKVDFEERGRERAENIGATGGRGTGDSPLGRRLGGVSEFATGGTLYANQPTLALFGEAGPEEVKFTPISQLSQGAGNAGRMTIEMTGSAPPGIGPGERDQIAAVLLSALRETGALER